MTKIAWLVFGVIVSAPTLFGATAPNDAERVWALEQTHWQYVQENDLQDYRALWHTDFLGWPSVSPEPLRKDHITDWITAHTGRGEILKSHDFEKLSRQMTGNTATVAYRVRQTWVDKSGADHTSIIRIIHTRLRGASGSWQIISGMSDPTNSEGR